jgi:hypothetical protein
LKRDLEGRKRISKMINGSSERKFMEADFGPNRIIGSERLKPVTDT